MFGSDIIEILIYTIDIVLFTILKWETTGLTSEISLRLKQMQAAPYHQKFRYNFHPQLKTTVKPTQIFFLSRLFGKASS